MKGSELVKLLAKAKANTKTGRPRTRHSSYINVRGASKPKCLLGTKLVRDEWEWLGYRSSSEWMSEFHKQLAYVKSCKEFDEACQSIEEPEEGSLAALLVKAKTITKRGRPRKVKPRLVKDDDQTEYGLKLLELEEKYPLNSYYWNDGASDPREIPWGSMDDLVALVDRLVP